MKNIEVFCGVSSLGLPFTKDNKNHVGYYDIIVNTLKNNGYNVTGFNLSRLNRNHTWDLEENLINNRSIEYLKNLQIKSIDDLREKNALFKLVVPESFKDTIKVNNSDRMISLRSLIESADNPIFLYNGGPNDFFTFIQAGPVELTDSTVRANLPKDIIPLLKQAVNNAENNWELLHSLNPNIRIYSLSYFYSPLYDKIQKIIYFQEKSKNRNLKYTNKFMEVIDIYNKMLIEASDKYDYVEHCDITFLKDHCAFMDFHPDVKGNKLIAETILKKLDMQLLHDNQR